MRRLNLLRAHGSPTRYLYTLHGCRCVACRAAEAERNRQYRAAHLGEKAQWTDRYRAEHPERLVESQRKYREAHPERVAESQRKYKAAHAEERAEYGRKYHAEHRVEHAERNRKYRAEHPEVDRRRHLLKTYGFDDWDERFAGQGGRCAVCGTEEPGSKLGWDTDHDHDTGTFRGILCHGCNVGLGGFRDDPERLMAAIEYLAAVAS